VRGTGDPEVIEDTEGGGEPSQNVVFNADADWNRRPEEKVVVNLVVVGATTVFSVLICAVVCLCFAGDARNSCALKRNDESQIEMLKESDIARVREDQEPQPSGNCSSLGIHTRIELDDSSTVD
jgi:hypothetical protein